MAKAVGTMIVDGQTYKDGEEIWDLGSLQCVEVNGNKRDYQGFINDKDKLPKYKNLGTGSSATLIDENGIESTIFAKYDSKKQKWYKLTGGIVV